MLDEPVNGLDIEGVKWMRDYLRSSAQSGRCILLSSHLLSELELVADRLVILADGVASRVGTLESLRADDAPSVLITCVDPAELLPHFIAAGQKPSQSPVSCGSWGEISRGWPAWCRRPLSRSPGSFSPHAGSRRSIWKKLRMLDRT